MLRAKHLGMKLERGSWTHGELWSRQELRALVGLFIAGSLLLFAWCAAAPEPVADGLQATEKAGDVEVVTGQTLKQSALRESDAGVKRVAITDFGFPAGADHTEAFRRAFDLVTAWGGGVVEIPPGVYRSAPLQLVSNLVLKFSKGATLEAIPDMKTWPVVAPLESYGHGREGAKSERREAFLYGDHLEHVRIIGDGGGVIDGSGKSWWDAKFKNRGRDFDQITLPSLIELRFSSHVEISGLRVQNSPLWTIHPYACQHVVIRNLEIVNPVDVKNTDGVDPDSSEDVLMENIVYTGGDDAVSIKSGWDCFGDERGFNKPSRNIVIRNFTVKATTSGAIAIGSEMSGGVEDVVVDGLRVEKAGSGGVLCIKTTAARGGYVRNVSLRHVRVGDVLGRTEALAAVYIAGKVGGWTPSKNPACETPPAHLPEVSGIELRDWRQMSGTRVHGPPVRIYGLEEGQIIRDLAMVHMCLEGEGPGLCTNADVTLNDVSFQGGGGWSKGKQRGESCSFHGEMSSTATASCD